MSIRSEMLTNPANSTRILRRFLVANRVNQGMLSFEGICSLIDTGKPLVWTMHDMWNMTGICHHAGDCGRFGGRCGECPLLGEKASPTDLSAAVWQKKHDLYNLGAIRFVAVSNWLKSKAQQSSLLSDQGMWM